MATGEFAGRRGSGTLSRDQLMYLFNRFTVLTSQPEVKKRISDAVHLDNQEAVAVTTAIQEEILNEMGIGCGDLEYGGGIQLGDGLAYQASTLNTFGVIEPLTLTDPSSGIASLGKINMDYEDDRNLMIHFYDFVSREEMLCEEAELGEVKFAERVDELHKFQEQQLKLLKVMRKFTLDEQAEILLKIQQKLEETNFQSPGMVITSDDIEKLVASHMK